MQPTLFERDLLLLSRIYGPVMPGLIVVADLPGGRGLGVKRVGEGPADDAADTVWLERDNPRQGSDSWLFGPVPREAVIGRVVARLWPSPHRF